MGNVVEGMRPLWSRVAHDPPPVPYQILAEQCWHEDPLSRPPFLEICERINGMMGLPDQESPQPLTGLRVMEGPRVLQDEEGGEKTEGEIEVTLNEDQMDKGDTMVKSSHSARAISLGLSSSNSVNTPVKRITSFRNVSSRFNSTLLPIRESEDPSTSGRKLIPVSGGAILVGNDPELNDWC